MHDLWSAIGALACELHSSRLHSIADSVSRLKSNWDFDRIRHAFGPNIEPEFLDKIQQYWNESASVTPLEVSAAFRVAAETSNYISSQGNIELVWTGQKTNLVPTRSTEQVLHQVIGSANSNLFLVSYAFHRAGSTIAALNQAVQKGVVTSILLESAIEHGGSVRGDSPAAMKRAVPGAKIFIWNPSSRSGGGAVHAKCAVADGRIAFITSANLTTAAMEKNMELGVLFRAGRIPECLHSHLDALVEKKVIEEFS